MADGVVAVFATSSTTQKKIGEGHLADAAHSVAIDQTTHRVYFPLQDIGAIPCSASCGRPVDFARPRKDRDGRGTVGLIARWLSSRRGVFLGRCAAVSFTLSAPRAKVLLDDVRPQMLARLLQACRTSETS